MLRYGIAALLIAVSAPAGAQKMDLSTITCQSFISGDQNGIGFILMWLDGYFTDEDDPPVVDFDALKKKGEQLGAFCAKNPTLGLITAAEKIMDK